MLKLIVLVSKKDCIAELQDTLTNIFNSVIHQLNVQKDMLTDGTCCENLYFNIWKLYSTRAVVWDDIFSYV